jgi:PleD family two-component response regulator
LNVDRFGAINERYGYRAGDEVLQQLVGSWLDVTSRILVGIELTLN